MLPGCGFSSGRMHGSCRSWTLSRKRRATRASGRWTDRRASAEATCGMRIRMWNRWSASPRPSDPRANLGSRRSASRPSVKTPLRMDWTTEIYFTPCPLLALLAVLRATECTHRSPWAVTSPAHHRNAWVWEVTLAGQVVSD